MSQHNIIYFSTNYALEKVHQLNFQVVAAYEFNNINILEFFKDIKFDNNCFKDEWACEATYSKIYKRKYISYFENDIENMFIVRMNNIIIKKLGKFT